MLRKTNDQLADKSCKLLEKAEKKRLEPSLDGSHETENGVLCSYGSTIASKETPVWRWEVCITQKHKQSITMNFWDKVKKY